jgi:hypothetical protein
MTGRRSRGLSIEEQIEEAEESFSKCSGVVYGICAVLGAVAWLRSLGWV